jgi:putative spermidine/putrescine transport system substrate-binding protein
MSGRFTRREFIVMGSAAAALAACGGTSSSSSSSPGGGLPRGSVTVTMFVFLGGDLGKMPKAFAQDYMQRHPNIKVQIYEDSNTVGYPKMLAAKRTTPDQPLVNLGFFNAQTTVQGILDGMWSKLDYGAMSNVKDVLPIFKRDDRYGIGAGADQIGNVYNTKLMSSAPTSWADLWDPANKGKVTFFDYFWYPVFVAARMNGGSLTNMQPGWDFWKAHAKQIRTIVTSNPQYLDVLSNGTAPLTSYFNGTGLQWKRGGAPLEYVPPKEGAINVPVYLQAVQGNTEDQTAVAHDMINEMLSPKWNEQWAVTSIQVPANQAVKLPSDMASLPAFQKDAVQKLVSIDWTTVAKNSSDWRQKWDQDVKANI